ncbi:MAG: calcium/sodium antiporter [Chloroflexaceae bacterium]|jgi:cation:H+ antiporter|nr:calcium/sodium antiporter [Chloroflexaceae bacterium]
MDLLTIGMILLGLVLLTVGGELLVRGASAIAAAVGISPLVIGLTVVAFGTSAPELAVSIQAGLGGSPDIAVGNVVGSNIFNVLFILGACALVAPLLVSVQLVRKEVPFMIGVSLLFVLLALDGGIQLWDGLLLFGLLIGYTSWSIISSRKETAAAQAEYAKEFGQEAEAKKGGPNMILSIMFVVGGLALLVFGGGMLVDGAIAIASAFGVSQAIIGLTIVAAGTSLPEVATSIIATIKGERDIAIGNVVGSNIFNILSILGLASIVTPGGLTVAPNILAFDIPIMIAVAISCLPIFFSGFSIERWEGALFLASYIAYTVFLIFVATSNPLLETFSNAMLLIAPLVVIVLGWTAFSAYRKHGLNGPGNATAAD